MPLVKGFCYLILLYVASFASSWVQVIMGTPRLKIYNKTPISISKPQPRNIKMMALDDDIISSGVRVDG